MFLRALHAGRDALTDRAPFGDIAFARMAT